MINALRCNGWPTMAALAALVAAPTAAAQPEPSFRSTCADLRAAIRKLDPKPDEYFTIEVTGALTDVRSDGVLTYLLMCAPPDPQVLCVTYSAGDRKRGDNAILAGTYNDRGPDHIMLDPCLHHAGASQAPAR
ncbi:MAG TPA: hypothetical protein VH743_05150 [Beijerinckiaceae bacterium]|jgi:hypothetical protein